MLVRDHPRPRRRAPLRHRAAGEQRPADAPRGPQRRHRQVVQRKESKGRASKVKDTETKIGQKALMKIVFIANRSSFTINRMIYLTKREKSVTTKVMKVTFLFLKTKLVVIKRFVRIRGKVRVYIRVIKMSISTKLSSTWRHHSVIITIHVICRMIFKYLFLLQISISPPHAPHFFIPVNAK